MRHAMGPARHSIEEWPCQEGPRLRSRLRESPPRYEGSPFTRLRDLAQPIQCAQPDDTIASHREALRRGVPLLLQTEGAWRIVLPEHARSISPSSPVSACQSVAPAVLSVDLDALRALTSLARGRQFVLALGAGAPYGMVDRPSLVSHAAEVVLRDEARGWEDAALPSPAGPNSGGPASDDPDSRGADSVGTTPPGSARALHEGLFGSDTVFWIYEPPGLRRREAGHLTLLGPVESVAGWTVPELERSAMEWVDPHCGDPLELLNRTWRASELHSMGQGVVRRRRRFRRSDGRWTWLEDQLFTHAPSRGRTCLVGLTIESGEEAGVDPWRDKERRVLDALAAELSPAALMGALDVISDDLGLSAALSLVGAPGSSHVCLQVQWVSPRSRGTLDSLLRKLGWTNSGPVSLEASPDLRALLYMPDAVHIADVARSNHALATHPLVAAFGEFVALPASVSDRFNGVVLLGSTEPGAASKRVIELLGRVQGAFTKGIEARYFAAQTDETRVELVKYLRQMEELNSALLRASQGDLRRAIEGLLAYLTELPGVQSAWVLGLGPGGAFRLLGSAQLRREPTIADRGAFVQACLRLADQTGAETDAGAVAESRSAGSLQRWVHGEFVWPSPLRAEGNLEGYLFISGDPGALQSDGMHKLLPSIARVCALSMSRHRGNRELQDLTETLERRVRERTGEMGVVYELSRQLVGAPSFAEGCREVFLHLERVVPLDAAAMLVVDPSGATVFVWPRRAIRPDVEAELCDLAWSAAFSGTQLARAGRELRAPSSIDKVSCRVPSDSLPAVHRVQSLLAVPLRAMDPDQPVGALVVAAESERAFDTHHAQVVETVANQAALALDLVRRVSAREHERLESVLQDLPIGVAVLDGEARVTLGNRVALELLSAMGYRRDDVVGVLGDAPVTDLLESDGPVDVHVRVPERAPVSGTGADAADGGPEAMAVGRMFELRAHEARGLQGKGWSNRHSLLVARDVTDERERQARALQQARLAVLGTLAHSVAHDFNNHLGVIMGYADLLREELDPLSPLLNDLAEVRRAALRAADIVRQLNAFSSKRDVRLAPVAVNQAVLNSQRMFQRVVGEHVRISVALQEGLPDAWVDDTYLHQVVTNLIINARDAMPEGGTLYLSTARRRPSRDLAEFWSLDPGTDYVTISVRDTGTGMDETTMSHIFEPYFTTKGQKEGTGLGLSTVYGIMRRLSGAISVTSRLHVGSEFVVYLPIAKGDEEGRRPDLRQSPTRRLATGVGRILVVEDEANVRDVLRRTLRHAGYEAEIVSTGQEALDRLAVVESAPLDLIVTDLSLGEGVSGREIVQVVQQNHPDLCVLIISGDLAPAIEWSDTVAFLQKPFSPFDLSRVAQQLLSARERR